MRTSRRALPVVLVAAGVLAVGAASARVAADFGRVEAELATARRTRDVVADKLAARDENLRGRVRALYKLSRGGMAPLWIDEGARADLVRRRAAARRLILRDLEERRVLRAELAAAAAAVERLEAEADAARAAAAAEPLAPKLVRPVRGRVLTRFGTSRDAATRARISRRGVELATSPGSAVVAPAAGRIRYVGPVRGLGMAVILDHGSDVLTVVGGLGESPLAVGGRVAAGDPVGRALTDRITLEVRRRGRPIDPETLLRR